jgi:uncharacterized protein YbdZ (MbtH family)
MKFFKSSNPTVCCLTVSDEETFHLWPEEMNRTHEKSFRKTCWSFWEREVVNSFKQEKNEKTK